MCVSRSKEVRFAKWDEVDTGARIWTVPWQRLKTGRKTKTDHVVPLSDRALAILAEMRELGVRITFPPVAPITRRWARWRSSTCSGGGSRSTPARMAFALRFAIGAAMRRTIRVSLAELALNHKIGDAAELAYRRGSAVEKRRELMDSWAAYCEPKPEGGAGNVVSLKRAWKA